MTPKNHYTTADYVLFSTTNGFLEIMVFLFVALSSIVWFPDIFSAMMGFASKLQNNFFKKMFSNSHAALQKLSEKRNHGNLEVHRLSLVTSILCHYQ